MNAGMPTKPLCLVRLVHLRVNYDVLRHIVYMVMLPLCGSGLLCIYPGTPFRHDLFPRVPTDDPMRLLQKGTEQGLSFRSSRSP